MLSQLLLTCRRGITWTSLRVGLGWLKCMGNRVINVVFDATSMLSEAFSQCAAGLANALTRKGGYFSMQRLQLIKWTRLLEEQNRFVRFFFVHQCCGKYKMMCHKQ